jgi:hypothetical protein
MVSPVKKKHATSMLIVQEAPRQRKGESLVVVGGPKEMEHILRGGINDAKGFKGIRQHKEMRDKVVLQKEYVWVGQAKLALKVFETGIRYLLATRP